MRAANLVVVTGCVNTLPPPPSVDGRTQFVQDVWPELAACTGCHAAQPAIDFLAPGTADGAYDTLFSFQPAIVDMKSPAASLLVTMGKHTGPALDGSSLDVISRWLEREQTDRAAPPAGTTTIGPIDLQMGAPVSLELPAGAHLAFVATAADGGVDLQQLAITAGAQGLHVVHPLFVTHPVELPAVVDELDRFGDVDATLAANETLALGGGEALFLDFDPSVPLSISFRTLEAP
jgi:hypothetical protein